MKIVILYSSGGGNTKLVVDAAKNQCIKQGVSVEEVSVVLAEKGDLKKGDLTILAAPTYDHGVLHSPFENYLDAVKGVDLTGSKFVVIGLGDNKYDNEYNIESALILEQFVTDAGGTLVYSSLKINKNPINQLDKVVVPWMKTVLDAMK